MLFHLHNDLVFHGFFCFTFIIGMMHAVSVQGKNVKKGKIKLPKEGTMKRLCKYLLSAACFSLCLSFAAPLSAEPSVQPSQGAENVPVQLSRADILLLLDNMVTLWKLQLNIGEEQPENAVLPETVGLVKNGQLSPSFVARTALQLIVTASDEGIMNFPEACENEKEKRELQRLFDGVPEQYRLFVPYAKLESTAQEWLGWPFDKSALPKSDLYVLKEDGVFIDDTRLFDSWPLFYQYEAFPEFYDLSPLENGIWHAEAEIRGIYQAENDILRVCRLDNVRMTVKKAGGYWRVLSFNFNMKYARR